MKASLIQENSSNISQLIEQAIVYLAQRCDGAVEDDGKGFNGADSAYGHSLYEQIMQGRSLSAKQKASAFKMLRKYRKQLEKGGVILPHALEEELEAVQKGDRTWQVTNHSKGTQYEVTTDGYVVMNCTCKGFEWGWCDHAKLIDAELEKRSGVAVFPNRIHPNVAVSIAVSVAVEGSDVAVCEAISKVLHSPQSIDKTELERSECSNVAISAISSQELNEHAIGLSENQFEAFNLAREWFASSPTEPFVLKGFAGTGKSFAIQRIVKSLKADVSSDRRFRVALCAPTHKARHVLEAMAQGADLSGVHIATLHSLCHITPGDFTADGKQKLKENAWSKEPHYRDFDLVIIDESSMIGDELMKFIPYQLVPTIFMGDPAQLPPVDESESELSPVFNLATGMELTQVMRYDGAIASYVTELRSDLTRQFPPKLVSGSNLSKLINDNWEEELISACKSVSFEEEPNAVRALAWTNKRVEQINQMIRAAIYRDADQQFLPDERLMAKEPIIYNKQTPYGSQKAIAMYSCAECTVQAVHTGTEQLLNGEITTYTLEVETDLGVELILTAVHESSFEVAKTALSAFKKEILAEVPELRKQMWKEFYELLERFNLAWKGSNLLHRLQYAYSLTVHQSQGSTFDRVFVDSGNILGCRDIRMRNQLLYTAYTRAAKHLYVRTKF